MVRHGHVDIDRRRNQAFPVDTVQLRPVRKGWEIVNPGGTPRRLRVVYEDDSSTRIRVERTAWVR